jgi:ketosteroid isomerase-like protein
MSRTDVSAQFRTIFASFDAKDVSTLAAFMTDDVRLRLGNAEMLQGKAAFVDAVNAFLGSIAGVRHEILNVYRDGDAAIVEFDMHYTRHDANVVTIACCNVFRLRDGLIAEYRSYIDATPVYAERRTLAVGRLRCFRVVRRRVSRNARALEHAGGDDSDDGAGDGLQRRSRFAEMVTRSAARVGRPMFPTRRQRH